MNYNKKIVCLGFAALLLLPLHARKPVLTIGLIADVQYGDCDPSIGRYYRNSLEKLTESVAYLNAQRVAFTINLGDLIDRNWNDVEAPLERLAHLRRHVYHLTGNHDYKDLTDNRVLYKRLGMPAEYYTLRKGKWVVVMLNTNEVASYAHIAGTDKEAELAAMMERIRIQKQPQGASYNGGVSQRQLKWLQQVLEEAQRRGDRVLVFSHHPLYPLTGFSALNSEDVLNVIDRYSCVKALFAGHHHAGHFAYYKKIPVITVEGMVETRENACGIVKLYKNKMVLEGVGRFTPREILLVP